MNRKVIACKDIKSLLSGNRCFDMNNCVHITATGNMAYHMKRILPASSRIIPVSTLTDAAFPEWKTNRTQFQQYINLSKIIRNLTECEENLKQSFKKNKQDVLKAIRMLVETGLNPEEIKVTSEEEKLFAEVWWLLEDEDLSYYGFRKSVKQYFEDSNSFYDAIKSNEINKKCKTIIVHGFYFITPLQETIFELLELCGFELIFVANYDCRNGRAEEIWKQVFSPKWGFADSTDWFEANDIGAAVNPLGSIFSEKAIETPSLNGKVKIIKYRNEMDFVEDFGRFIDSSIPVYTMDMDKANNLLKEFYPESFKRKNLLSYPIGQYIFSLNSMWNESTKQLELNCEMLQKCFSSGWLEYNGKNAVDYVKDLEKLIPYIEDCKTVDEWRDRMGILQCVQSELFPELEKHIENGEVERPQIHRILANPLRNFSCFSIDKERLSVLLGFVDSIISNAEDLFECNSENEVDISLHLRRLKSILNKSREGSRYEEEKIILDELVSRFNINNLEVGFCSPADLSEALGMIAGGGIVDLEENEILNEQDQKMVKPIEEIEAESITENEVVHLCICDERRMPREDNSLPWPLTHKLIDDTILVSQAQRKKLLGLLLLIIDSRVMAHRYLLSSLLENQNVELSWIEEDDDNDVDMSVYLRLLSEYFSIDVSVYERDRTCNNVIREKCENTSLKKANLDIDELVLDEEICVDRYRYGYILDRQPAFSSSFHYQFAVMALIRAIISTAGITKMNANKMVMELFPFYLPVEKQQIFDFTNSRFRDDGDYIDNVLYPKERLNIHFLKENITTWVVQGYCEHMETGRKRICLDTEKCRYCPHIDYCTNAKRGGAYD